METGDEQQQETTGEESVEEFKQEVEDDPSTAKPSDEEPDEIGSAQAASDERARAASAAERRAMERLLTSKGVTGAWPVGQTHNEPQRPVGQRAA